jgi:hypothetical protein
MACAGKEGSLQKRRRGETPKAQLRRHYGVFLSIPPFLSCCLLPFDMYHPLLLRWEGGGLWFLLFCEWQWVTARFISCNIRLFFLFFHVQLCLLERARDVEKLSFEPLVITWSKDSPFLM